MTWNIAFFVIALVCGLLGVWFLARNGNFFTAIGAILWFLYVLFEQYLPKVSTFHLAGFPQLGTLVLYFFMPVCLVASFFTGGSRR